MNRLPNNLPALLRAAGLKVVEIDGWENRSRPASTGGFGPVGSLNHHTGASAKSWSAAKRKAYAIWLATVGRSDLPAPLCHLSLDPAGVVYICAAGRANHAGVAKASGSVAAGDGNMLYVGTEWMLSGTETIPAVMYRAGATLNAVITHLLGSSVQAVSCHFQTSVTGKWDIGDPNGVTFGDKRVLDVGKFRGAVEAERKRLYAKRSARLRVGVINIPIKVQQDSWIKCWTLMAKRAAIFGVNESFTKAQRDTYKGLMKSMGTKGAPMRQYGLRRCGNPIFWRHKRFEFVSGKIHSLHGKGPEPLSRKYPGFNAPRTANEVVLRQRSDGQEFAIINTHLVPNGSKVDDAWRKKVRKESVALLRDLVAKHQAAGRIVVLMGDMNIATEIKMPKFFHWWRKIGIDKIGGNRVGAAHTFVAPTDHKHGVVATVALNRK